MADQLIADGKATQPFLGVGLGELSPEDAKQFGIPVDGGVLVANVERGGPAADAGLERGDVITAAGDVEIASYGDLLGALRGYRPGDTINLTVVRDGKEQQFEVELGERSQGEYRGHEERWHVEETADRGLRDRYDRGWGNRGTRAEGALASVGGGARGRA